MYTFYAGTISFKPAGTTGQTLEVTVDKIVEEQARIVIELQIRGSRSGNALIFADKINNAVGIDPGVDVAAMAGALRQHRIASLFRESGSQSTLFIERYGRLRVAFVSINYLGQAGRYRLAIYLENMLQLDTLFDHGEGFYAIGKEAEGIRHWEFILTRYGLHRKALYRLAEIYFARGDFERAEDIYEKTIDLDERDWTYPEARLYYARAKDQQGEILGRKHQMCLEDYIRFDKVDAVHEARMLLIQAKKPVAIQPIVIEEVRALSREIERTGPAVVYFWSPACSSCWRDLDQLFSFSIENRDISFYIVAIDDGNELKHLEWRMGKKYAPFWPLKGSSNVEFYVDELGYLSEAISPDDGLNLDVLPVALFMQKQTVVRHQAGEIFWDRLRTEHIWNKQ